MANKVVYIANARQDVQEAARWYRAESPVLAKRFREQLRKYLDHVRMNPLMYTEEAPGVRRAVLETFPYEVF